MKNLLRAAALVAAFTSLAANAATYDFSYTFGDNTLLTGSLNGDLVGSFLENISAIHVTVKGVDFSGTLLAQQIDPTNYSLDNAVKISTTDVTKNNFIFADFVGNPNDYNYSNSFSMINDANGLQIMSANTNVLIDNTSLDNVANGSWKVVEVAPVPLPGALSLLMSGMGLLGSLRLRRRAS